MFLQGNLQIVFDALHNLGIIDPVIHQDWSEAMAELPAYSDQLAQAVKVANEFQSDSHRLESELTRFDEQTLSFLAMEVARELADFHSRQTLH